MKLIKKSPVVAVALVLCIAALTSAIASESAGLFMPNRDRVPNLPRESKRGTGIAPGVERMLSNPKDARLQVWVKNLYAHTNTFLELKIGNQRRVFHGAGVDDFGQLVSTNHGPAVFSVSLRREYKLSITCTNTGFSDNSGTAQIEFRVVPQQEYDVKKTQPPSQFTILNNRTVLEPGTDVLLGKPDAGFISTNYGTLEITTERFANWKMNDVSMDPRPSPGEGKWLSIGPMKSMETNAITIDWSVSLGRLFDGLAAGRLRLHELELTRESYQPPAIYYNAGSTNIRSQVELVTTNFAGVLRQVKSLQTFVDILAPDTNQTVLKFYFPSQVATNTDTSGVYTTISGNPFVTWTIQNPEPSSTNRLLIIEERNLVRTTNSLAKVVTPSGVKWTLKYGSGATEREETRDMAFVSSPEAKRYETNTVRYVSGSVAYAATETYKLFPWGTELIEVRVMSTPEQVTSFDYYSDTNAPFGFFGYGQIKQVRYPNSRWEKRIYQNLEETFWYPTLEQYADGLLRYVLEPDDEMNDGAREPGDATLANSIVNKFSYYSYDLMGRVSGRTSCRFGVAEGTQEPVCVSAQMANVTEGYPNLEGTSSRSIRSVPGWKVTLNRITSEYTDCPPGLAGHLAVEEASDGPTVFHYYDHGVYDTNTKAFLLNPSDHLYTDMAGTNRYPDHRETSLLLESWFGRVVPPDEPSDWFQPAEFLSTMEDHPLGNSERAFYKGVTSKQTSIYQGGNLVQTEVYLYTGAESGTPCWSLLSQVHYYNDSLGHATNITRVDPVSRTARVLSNYDYRDSSGKDGVLLRQHIDEHGAKRDYSYDTLLRPSEVKTKGFGSQPDTVVLTMYDAAGRSLTNTVSSGNLSQKESRQFDLAGRQTAYVDASGTMFLTTYSSDGRCATNALPGGLKTVIEKFTTDQVRSITGDAVVNEFRSNSVGLLSWPLRKTTIRLGSPDSPRWEVKGQDWFNFESFHESPIGENTTNTISEIQDFVTSGGLLSSKSRSSHLALTEYGYDPMGNLSITRTGGLGGRYVCTDQISLVLNGKGYRASTNYVYLTDNDNSSRTITGIRLEQLNGFAQDEIARVLEYDADLNLTVTTTFLDRSQNRITTVTSQPATSTLDATVVLQNGLLIQSSTMSVAEPVRYTYDALGRSNTVTDSLGFKTSLTYYPDTGWLESVTDPAFNTTRYEYYPVNHVNAGKTKCVTAPTGKKSYFSYTTRGELYRTWGDVPYPSEYRYNQYGDLTNLITFRGGSQWSAATWPSGSTGAGDNTYWVHDEASGALLRKVDAQGRATTYSYCTNTGRLLTRSWQRTVAGQLVTVTNTFNEFDDLLLQEYSDGTPNVAFNSYNRIGLPREIIDARGTNIMAYDNVGRLVASIGGDGCLSGVTVSNHFNAAFGRDRIEVAGVSSSIAQDFGYDAYGRLASVRSGSYGAAYGYVPNSDLLQTTTFTSAANTIMSTARRWEFGMRLGGIVNQINGGEVVSSHSYAYDSANRRTRAYLEDGSVWIYGYNDRDELTSANRYWNDWLPYSGQQFGYIYDNIGNRQRSTVGGDKSGTNLREISYTANNLNQYTRVLTPGAAHISGLAFSTNSVSVNSGLTERRGEWFDREISIANTNTPVWQQVGITDGLVSSNGGFVFPRYDQQLDYDFDGNLTADGLWTYEWDAENRLKAMTMTNTVSSLPTQQRKRLEFGYDFMGRRFSKVVKTWNGSTFASPITNLFVYDGWNLIATITPAKTVLTSFLWGQDLSGTMTEAGGVGGLLAMFEGANAHVAAYDGHGNVTGLVKSDRTISARYEYSPYGETLRVTGPLASLNPFRWSTRFCDEDAGLVFYPTRAYQPRHGRWLARDSIGEDGGINLYAFLQNGSLNDCDPLGMMGTLEDQEAATALGVGLALGGTTIAAGVLQVIRETAALWNASQIGIFNSSSSDDDDDYLIDQLGELNISLSGQLANQIPDPDDDDSGKGIRRSSKGGNNQAQNKITDGAATEAGLNSTGRAELKRLVEKISRGGEESPDYQTILRMAKELAEHAKYTS